MKQGILYVPPKTAIWCESGDDGLTFEKELIYEGEFQQANGRGFGVDEVTLRHWASTFADMSQNGVSVPLPVGHTENPESNRGTVQGMHVRRNEDGKAALFATVRFRDEKAAELAKTTQVSIFSPPEFVDGKGNRYVRPIRHVALTDYPVIPALQGFESIAASFVSDERKGNMPLLDITKKLSIECDAEDKAEAAIVAAFEKVASDNTKSLEDKDAVIASKDEEIAALKKRIPADPIKVVASHRSMLRDNRTMKLDRLVGEKISPAVRDALLEIYCSDDQLNLVLSSENADDSFDKIVDALGKNEVVELSQQSGPQGGTPLQKDKGPAPNPLLADAKKRAEAAS